MFYSTSISEHGENALAELELLFSSDVVDQHVVFVHGLGGNNKTYWLSSSRAPESWLLWLKDDLQNIAIWEVRYDASHSRWRGTAMALADRGENVLALLG